MTTKEQRSHFRHEFSYDQLVAVVADGKMPSLGDFRTVPCENLSCGGIAFCLDQEPGGDEYVIALGHPRELIYVCARVVHTSKVCCEGQVWYRVGCQFTDRAHFDRSTRCIVRMAGQPTGLGETPTGSR